MSDAKPQNRQRFAPGETIFAEGSHGEEMYVLASGEVEIKKKVGSGQTLLKVVTLAGDFFGEMALVDNAPRSASAVASEETELIVVNQATFEHMVVTNGQFALKVIRTLADRIRRTNLEITELIDTAPRDRFVFGMVDFAVKHGEKLYNKGYKVNLDAMKEWVHSQLGMPRKEIDAYVYRLIRHNETPFASTAQKSQDHVVLTEEFVARHNRREGSRAPEAPSDG